MVKWELKETGKCPKGRERSRSKRLLEEFLRKKSVEIRLRKMFVNRWKLTMGFWGPLRLGEYLQGEERKEEKEKKEEEVVEVLEGR